MADILELHMANEGPVVVQRAPSLTRLVIAAPPANALSLAVMDALLAGLAEAAADKTNRVVVIAGEGKVFSAGHDLKELTGHRSDPDGGRAFFAATMQKCAELMQAIVRHPSPVIAEVNGLATAAGCQLVASCDLAIASEEAQFCTPGVNIGLFCSTPMVALSRNLSPKHAMEMLLTGETIDARSARDFGLVNRVVPPEYLGTVVGKYATTIASKSAATVKTGKEAFYRQAEMGLTDAYAYTAEVMVENMLAKDAEEGIGAFLQKRKPEWTHE
ncbi:enoyl-CoA hydratase [Aurantimonas endophytica]|uniref:Enoyl-CoA hydratase domain-containing protein 3, mitochondrial n=1 Tax=Aurantimonas endophytica TaxID=1522175 RepID=A0A7W6MMS2_9HYPH|nr:enoyl-CoA hydratase [Aurantimonas endophytica]MBB4001113.1 enoyl-CoA hydratase/carnithine racemase [Aurantimonas endophytica]MCO6403232.1 enoyl-CoA hydratase [Aurantimonas endophytica]